MLLKFLPVSILPSIFIALDIGTTHKLTNLGAVVSPLDISYMYMIRSLPLHAPRV